MLWPVGGNRKWSAGSRIRQHNRQKKRAQDLLRGDAIGLAAGRREPRRRPHNGARWDVIPIAWPVHDAKATARGALSRRNRFGVRARQRQRRQIFFDATARKLAWQEDLGSLNGRRASTRKFLQRLLLFCVHFPSQLSTRLMVFPFVCSQDARPSCSIRASSSTISSNKLSRHVNCTRELDGLAGRPNKSPAENIPNSCRSRPGSWALFIVVGAEQNNECCRSLFSLKPPAYWFGVGRRTLASSPRRPSSNAPARRRHASNKSFRWRVKFNGI